MQAEFKDKAKKSWNESKSLKNVAPLNWLFLLHQKPYKVFEPKFVFLNLVYIVRANLSLFHTFCMLLQLKDVELYTIQFLFYNTKYYITKYENNVKPSNTWSYYATTVN